MNRATGIPTGYCMRQVGSRTVVLRQDLEAQLTRLGFPEGAPRVEPETRLGGRVPHPVYALPGSGLRVLWKRCRRGGWVEPILGERHWNTARFWKELHITAAAHAQGLPVAEVLGLAIEPLGKGWKRVELISPLVEGARDLAAGLTELEPRRRRAVLRQCAGVLSEFHSAGFLHGDLNVKNLLWRVASDDSVVVTLIDLDQGPLRFPGNARSPLGNLLRLHRSYLKGERAGRWRLPSSDLYAFLLEYFHGDGAAVRDFWVRARRRKALRAVLSRHPEAVSQ